ncbi:AAA family ATPase [Phenylobacterium sp.]|uniref:nucleotide-binding protein n=1 Tax=Phenylobacterium sp. TaxID=1871053 RepID=UPI0025EB47D2|nr:AAA family ATPase [Phenylobacterium sp.]MCA6274974.1 AAA family ATPase [Phenylobacterium sp.]
MKTLAILSRKGGAGKTTLALHLAVQAVAGGRRVALVDMDPQRSAADWWRSREADAPELVEVEPGQLGAVVAAAEDAGVDLVVIDTRPSAEADALEAAQLADLALIVCRPTVLDLRAVAATVETVQLSGTPGLVVVNQAPPARGIAEAAITREAVEALRGYGLPLAQTIIHARASFHAALIDGRAVLELEPEGKAAHEIRALWAELEGSL